MKDTDSRPGLEAVILHIEISEKHYELGRQLGEYLYTDVIYRTNQAYEGALKEAYRVLAGKEPSSKSPYQIERHLEQGKLLKERVLLQLRNYRTEWRNKSTHDYQLFFSAQEALLAIVSVSAFFNILLDQMLEKHAYEMEKSRSEQQLQSSPPNAADYRALTFAQQCVQLLTKFSENIAPGDSTTKFEYELLGQLAGFIEQVDPQIKATTTPVIRHGTQRMEADLLLQKEDSTVLIEVKRPSLDKKRRIRDGLQQVKAYMAASGIKDAIIFMPPRLSEEGLEVTEVTEDSGDRDNKIVIVAPIKF
ncbi:hypothetical protein [Massilia agri]